MTGDRPRGYSLLHVAAGADQADTAEWLLDNGASVDGAIAHAAIC